MADKKAGTKKGAPQVRKQGGRKQPPSRSRAKASGAAKPRKK